MAGILIIVRNKTVFSTISILSMNKIIQGFSKLSKQAKIEWLVCKYFENSSYAREILIQYWNENKQLQKLHDEFAENTLSNYYMPFSIAPNFLINNHLIAIPMAIEESSVVAAASKTATFWGSRGGFKSKVLSVKKIGHVHFVYYGDFKKLKTFFNKIKYRFFEDTQPITKNMRVRGGGILDIKLLDKHDLEPNYYQLFAEFDTKDSMGANFINSCLEQFAKTLVSEISMATEFSEKERQIQIIMCILSNYTPQCLVRAEASCNVEELSVGSEISNLEFAEKFERAIHVATIEPYRAVTHNKGIMNGVDAVVIATGNDFRATEACAHAYAARQGSYKSLTQVEIKNGIFRFWLDLPISIGTVGGLTSLHPLAKLALQILGNPNANQLMEVIAVAGLSQNFAAIRSLVTTGIQKGHMKMHLFNILNQLEATEKERDYFVEYFKDHTVSYSAVVEEFKRLKGV